MKILSKLTRKPALRIGKSPSLEFERGAGFPHFRVFGIDEVGRGCLAGPVVAGAVCLPPDWDLTPRKLRKKFPEIEGITDSKKMTAKLRAELAPWIRANVACYGIGFATVEEIDEINIYHASHLAMRRAAEAAGSHDHALIDGHVIPKAWDRPATPIVKGDLRALSIACASILAKVHRDEWMERYAEEHPGFGFEVHKGYGTPKHLVALKTLGATVIHRRSFAPVRQILGLPVDLSDQLLAEQTLNLFAGNESDAAESEDHQSSESTEPAESAESSESTEPSEFERFSSSSS